jgi:energy-coupling factor transporter ATP-binding protein EcfA2
MSGVVLDVRGLSFHYPDGRPVLRDVSFRLAAGESIAIVGPNGAGKSTLLLHLNGILPGRASYEHHHHGHNGLTHSHTGEPRVWVDGLAVAGPNLPQVRRRVGLLFQDPDDQLFCPTVIEDVTFGPRNMGHAAAAAREIAQRCLTAVGLSGYDDRAPHRLSFGERKRVCLAGVLACEPSILSLDEPTSNLDPRGRRQFMHILRELPAAKVIATHDLEMVLELCSRVIVLNDGRIHADGPTREVLSDQVLLEQHGLEVPLSIRYGAGAQRLGPPHGPFMEDD